MYVYSYSVAYLHSTVQWKQILMWLLSAESLAKSKTPWATNAEPGGMAMKTMMIVMQAWLGT